ncbi:MAG: SDR family oxidoreductase [Candidatus Fimivivens sp.]|nr:SDR family oxidoreductase [Candidatus Fimivivens sp.]
MINPMEMSGKHIIVTGASSGIGKATAINLSKLGAVVTIIARREDKLKDTLSTMEGDVHNYFICDVSDLKSIESCIKEIVAAKGPADGFVHCAGIGSNRPISLTKPEFIKEMMEVNFFAFAEFLRVLSKRRNSNEGASFVGISSVASIRGDKAQGGYAATKAAMNGILHSYAKELADRRIRLNTVAFGMINTEMYQEYIANGGSSESLNGQYLGIGELEDAANIISFLLSDASKFITGTTLVADGGYLS